MKNKPKSFIALFLIAVCAFAIGIHGACSDGQNGENTDAVYTVKFEVCSDLPTNAALDQKVKYGSFVSQPDVQVRGDNPEGKKIIGWYEDADYQSEWDFGLDKVTENLTLYAKWASFCSVDFYLKNAESPIYSTEVKSGRKVSACDDRLYGYKINGYYKSENFDAENAFDFSQAITENTDIYIDVEDYFYFDAQSMANSFRAVAAVSGAGSTAGSVLYETKNGENYIRANFGYSTARDPYIVAESLNLDITKSQIIEIKFKNLGKANQLMFYWILKDKNGDFIGGSDYSAACSLCYTYSASEMNMKEDGEWLTLRFNVAAGEYSSGDNFWKDATTLYSLRIQSLYKSESSTDLSNEMLISYVKGVYDEEYDSSKNLVRFNVGGVTRELRISGGEAIGKVRAAEKCAGYKVIGYYTDSEYKNEFDVQNTKINFNTEIFVKTDGVYYDADALYNNFAPTPATQTGSEAGKAEKDDRGFVKVNFGYSLVGDPGFTVSNARLNISKVNKIRIKIKNLGYATELALYWTAKDENGNFVGNAGDYSESCSVWKGLSSDQISMTEDGEWTIVEFDLSANGNWQKSTELVKLRIQSNYVSKSKTDLSNVIYFYELEGIE